jgi:aquaporin-3
MLLLRRLSFLKFFIYVSAQLLGAFLASASVYLTYIDSIKGYLAECNRILKENNNNSTCSEFDTATIFTTFPTNNLSLFGGFFDQFLATSLFIVAVLAITDKKNINIQQYNVAILIGIAMMVIGASFGFNSGFAVNPARDFAPRIFTALAGWGWGSFRNGNYFFWIPLCVPFISSLVATFIYQVIISSQI